MPIRNQVKTPNKLCISLDYVDKSTRHHVTGFLKTGSVVFIQKQQQQTQWEHIFITRREKKQAEQVYIVWWRTLRKSKCYGTSTCLE